MPVKKPSVKPAKAKKTVSAKAAKPTPKAASKDKAVPRKPGMAKPAPKAAAKPAARPAAKPAARPTPKPAVKAVPRTDTRLTPVEKALQKAQAAARPAKLSSDDGDPAANASLLSGPRNVQPYVVRKGEEYMNKAQLEHFRTILSSWKKDLMQEVDRTVLHMKDEAANFPDPNDRATQESEFSLELRTRDRERKLIRKIEEALKRIEDGSYGYCLETGEPIGVKRLEARPVATLSVEAQERRERREKQFGDRDDWYR
jgi:DnaK suppressor protein